MNSSVTIYLDNFRGFTQTVFQLSDINFFVGENSTGKTSVLALVNAILSPQFWFTQQFNSEEHDFGGFRDMLSASAPHGSEFTIGAHQVLQLKEGKQKRLGFIASFREHEGLPTCSFFVRLEESTLTALRLVQPDVYQFATCEITDNAAKIASGKETFAYLEAWKNAPTTPFKEFPEKMPARLGLLPLIHIAAASDVKKPDREKEFPWLAMPVAPYEITWLAPIRTRPHRTYDGYGKGFSPEGEHTPYLLRKRLGSKEKAETFEKSLRHFGKASGLFKKVSIHSLGRGSADPFEILVTLSSNKRRALEVNCLLVDEHEKVVSGITGRSCNDTHIIAIFRVSGCRLLCSNDKRSFKHIKNSKLYMPGQKRPMIYRGRKHCNLLCARNIVEIRHVA